MGGGGWPGSLRPLAVGGRGRIARLVLKAVQAQRNGRGEAPRGSRGDRIRRLPPPEPPLQLLVRVPAKTTRCTRDGVATRRLRPQCRRGGFAVRGSGRSGSSRPRRRQGGLAACGSGRIAHVVIQPFQAQRSARAEAPRGSRGDRLDGRYGPMRLHGGEATAERGSRGNAHPHWLARPAQKNIGSGPGAVVVTW